MLNTLFLALTVCGVCTGFDLETYKQQHRLMVCVPYKKAISIAATDIIEYLAIYPVPRSTASGLQVVEKLHILTERFRNQLIDADEASNIMRQETDLEVERLVAEAANVEKQIALNEEHIQQVNAQIQQANLQVAEAQKQVDAARASVAHAQQVVEEESRKVRKEKHCTGIPIVDDIVCEIVNVFFGNIDGAKRDRDRAQGDLNGQQNRLNQFQGTLNQYQQQQAQLQQTKANFENTKAQLNTQLHQSNDARNSAMSASATLKGVITHLTTLLGRSQVLADVVKHLIDMENMIIPLTSVGDQIIGYSADMDDITYLNEMKQKIAINIPVVQLRLPQYGLIHIG